MSTTADSTGPDIPGLSFSVVASQNLDIWDTATFCRAVQVQTKEEARRVETLPQPRSTGFTAMLGEFHGHAHRVFTVTLNDSTVITLTASSGKNSRGNKSDIKMASQVISMMPVTRDKVIHIGDPLGRSGVHHIVWLIDGNGGIPPLSSRLILANIHA